MFFSRYHWFVPLEAKRSARISESLVKIYKEHGLPKVIQHDQGTEYEGGVKELCKALKIEVIKGRPITLNLKAKLNVRIGCIEKSSSTIC